ncbi:MAG TPA: Stf0 family sulfotransferase [Chthoniobacterales bacterium]|jgi:LPS sulfotransferase NodH
MGGLFHNLRHPRRCYVVCAIARSGSNFLTDGLRTTGRAGRPKQFFLPKYQPTYAAKNGLAGTDFADYVRGIIAATATSNEVFGFKLMGWYLAEFLGRLRETGAFGADDDEELDILRTAFPRLQFIQIVRLNKIRQAVSKARAAQTGLWKVQEGNVANGEAEFDPDLIASCLEDTQREERIWAEFFQRIGLNPLCVVYEELCEDYSGTIGRVLDYLEIKLPRSVRPKPETVRQTDSLSREWEERFLALA